jgi:DNA-binding XRE family transcriptional regulator
MTEPTDGFWERVYQTHEHGCWMWHGPHNDSGYGLWSGIGAHRYSWQLTNGPILDGLKILHICDNPPCVNPRHLYAGTDAQNALDAMTRSWKHGDPSAEVPDFADAQRMRDELKSGKARQARIDAGVSGAEMARELQRHGYSVTPQAVFYWETGQNQPTVEHALAYGRVLAALAKRAA